jgi:hypothetical protein
VSGDIFVNVSLRLQLTCLVLSAICCYRLCLFRVLLDTCPFYFLQCTVLPSFCNCSLFLLRVAWGGAPPPVSRGVSHTLAAVTSLPFSKHTEGGGATPAFSGRLVYLQFHEGVPLLPFWSSGHPTLFATCLFF